MDKLKMHSPDFTEQNIARLAELFPNCVTEAKDDNGNLKKAIDFDQLRQELSGSVVDGPRERYHLDWPGKKDALLTANAPIAKTLRPCRDESVDFNATHNLFIEGDNLDALKLLQETYLNKVKMIYIDPPYNTGHDFIYDDDFSEDSEAYFLRSNQRDESSNRLVANTESNGRFHSDWLSMMYPRLKLARTLLCDDGVLFMSIGGEELCNLTQLANLVFGEINFLGCITRIAKTTSFRGNFLAPSKDYVLCFAKDVIHTTRFREQVDASQYTKVEKDGPRRGEKYRDDIAFYLTTLETRPNQRYFVECPDGSKVIPPGTTYPPEKPVDGDGVWRWSESSFRDKLELIVCKPSNRSPLIDENGEPAKWNIYTKSYLAEKLEKGNLPRDYWEGHLNRHGTSELKALEIPYSFPKPVSLVSKMIEITQTKDMDIILDFFAGSCTTAHAVLSANATDGARRRFIMIQLPEGCDEESDAFQAGFKDIAAIGKERIRRAGKKLKEENAITAPDLDIGFRVLRIDTSNMKDVYYAPDGVKQGDLLDQIENIKEDRTPEDLLFQVLLDWGVDLSLPIVEETIEGKTVFFVDKNALAACFDSDINEELVKKLAARKPLRVIFRDSGYGNDSVKINVEQIFKLISPSTDVKSI